MFVRRGTGWELRLFALQRKGKLPTGKAGVFAGNDKISLDWQRLSVENLAKISATTH